MIQCLSFRQCACACVYSSISICGRKERNWRAERAINANLVISVAPTVSHGRNKYPLATVKTSTIAPTVYDPPLHHGFTRAWIPPPPSSPSISDRICIGTGLSRWFYEVSYRSRLSRSRRGEKNGWFYIGGIHHFLSFFLFFSRRWDRTKLARGRVVNELRTIDAGAPMFLLELDPDFSRSIFARYIYRGRSFERLAWRKNKKWNNRI